MTITESDNYFCGTVNTCCHLVSFWYDVEGIDLTDNLKEILTEHAEERAEQFIPEGGWCGELNCSDQEIRGWWQIDHEKEGIARGPVNIMKAITAIWLVQDRRYGSRVKYVSTDRDAAVDYAKHYYTENIEDEAERQKIMDSYKFIDGELFEAEVDEPLCSIYSMEVKDG